MDSRSPQYRRDIDGLRAVAVLGVLLFHLFPRTLPGGFLGVDVFFVISGFLISRIIWTDLSKDQFQLREFYSRRIRRIFPALAAVLIAAYLLGLRLLVWDEFARLGKHIFASSLFFMNFAQMGEGGYFDVAAEHKPLLHLWSLSIEEQFYLIWPLLLSCLGFARKRTLGVLYGLFLLSFGYDLLLLSREPVAAFYSPLARGWELILGAIIGFHAFSPKPTTSSPLLFQRGSWASLLGIVLVLGSFLLVHESSPLPGFLSLFPCLGAGFILWNNAGEWAWKSPLRNPILVGIGRISYPLYLWHWLLFSFFFISRNAEVDSLERGALLCISFLLAALTYRFIERPIQNGRRSFSGVMILMILVLSIGVIGRITQIQEGFAKRELEAQPFIASPKSVLEWLPTVRPDICHIQQQTYASHSEQCFEGQSPHVVLWGDSHGAALYAGLRDLQKERTFGLTQLTQAGCPPLFDVESIFQKDCPRINQDIFDVVGALQPEVLILHAGWIHRHYVLTNEEILSQFERTIKTIAGKLPRTRILIIGPMPRWDPSLPEVLNAYQEGHRTIPPRYLPLPNPSLTSRFRELDAELEKRAVSAGCIYVSPMRILCEDILCLTRFGDSSDELMVVDDSHLTSQGSRYFVSHIATQIFGP